MTLSVIPPFSLTHQNHAHNWPRPHFRLQPIFQSSNYPWARAHWGVHLFVPCQHWWGRWQRFDWSIQTRRTHIYPFLFPLKGFDQQQQCGANVEATDTWTRQYRWWDCLLDRTNQEHRLLASARTTSSFTYNGIKQSHYLNSPPSSSSSSSNEEEKQIDLLGTKFLKFSSNLDGVSNDKKFDVLSQHTAITPQVSRLWSKWKIWRFWYVILLLL